MILLGIDGSDILDDILMYRWILQLFKYTIHMTTHSMSPLMCIKGGCRYRYGLVSYLKLVIGQDLSLVKLKFRPVERVLIVWLKVRWKELQLRLPKPKKPLYSLRGRLKHLRLETRHLSWQHVRSVIGDCSTGGGNPGALCGHTETFKLIFQPLALGWFSEQGQVIWTAISK